MLGGEGDHSYYVSVLSSYCIPSSGTKKSDKLQPTLPGHLHKRKIKNKDMSVHTSQGNQEPNDYTFGLLKTPKTYYIKWKIA